MKIIALALLSTIAISQLPAYAGYPYSPPRINSPTYRSVQPVSVQGLSNLTHTPGRPVGIRRLSNWMHHKSSK